MGYRACHAERSVCYGNLCLESRIRLMVTLDSLMASKAISLKDRGIVMVGKVGGYVLKLWCTRRDDTDKD